MIQHLKHLIKKYAVYFWVRSKLSPAVQLAQRQIYLQHQERASRGFIPPLSDTGFKVFSQYEEDGLLLFIFAMIGMPHRTFVDIGSNDGINSNCANLALHFGWHGLFIDADPRVIERGLYFYKRYPDPWSFPPVFVQAKVTRENINTLISEAGFSGEVDLLSVDIDGNDYWIWDALEVIRPRVVIIETHVEFGLENIVVPYDPEYVFPGRHPVYHGASPVAMVALGRRKGYRLVGANAFGHNALFVREDLGVDTLPEAEAAVMLRHPSTRAHQHRFEAVRDWEYVKG